MSLPGFTAELSLYKTSEQYKVDGVVGAAVGSENVVQPSQCFVDSYPAFCYNHQQWFRQVCIYAGMPYEAGYVPLGSC